MSETVLLHPNRDKAEAKATKAAVILLLLASAALILIVMIGGWSQLQGAQIISFFYAARLPRDGVLRQPLEPRRPAGRRRPGGAVRGDRRRRRPRLVRARQGRLRRPDARPGLLGLLTLILVPLQLLLVAFAMRGFQQQWNVEVEVTRDEADRYRRGDLGGGELHPAQP